MNIPATLANTVWSTAALSARRRYRAALARPAAEQSALLSRYLRDNAETEVGRRYEFAALLAKAGAGADLANAYRDAVPIATYDDLEPDITRIAAGEQQILTRAPVVRLAPSSGSTSAAKLVPQTVISQRELSRAVDAWIGDLFFSTPALLGGPAYWSITPSISFDAIAAARLGSTARVTVPIGFDDDAAYLGGLRQRLLEAILAVPNDLRTIADPESFRYVTLLFLVRARALRLISVWHPSFLALLLDALPTALDRIAQDLHDGTITTPHPLGQGLRARLTRRLKADRRVAREIGKLRSASPSSVWPALRLVSCWGDAAAEPYARRLAGAVDPAAIQAKGLIATEGIVSIPFAGQHPVALTSHFVEMIDASGRSHLIHETSIGEEYDVVLTTGSGLYRYALGDRVRVTGWAGATPSIAFVGRADRVSDRYGEKLNDRFVSAVLSELFAPSAAPRFAMLTPEPVDNGLAYTLLVEPSAALPENLAASLESALRRNPHYAWCVDLGQLRPARVVRVGPRAERAYLDACVARGQRLGDVKPATLQRDSGWEQSLTGLAS